MNKMKLISGIFAYLLVIGIYAAFFAYPVHPATASSEQYKEVESKVYSSFPYVIYKIYIRGSIQPGILLVATVRTPFMPDSTYSKVLRSMEGIIENETKERYKADIDLQYVREIDAEIDNHSVVMDYYDVHLKYLQGQWFNPTTLKLYFGAFFCSSNYETVIVAFVAPPLYESDFDAVMGSISC